MTCYLIHQSCTAPLRILFMLMPALHWLSFDFALLVAWYGISHMPTHSFPCLSSGYVPFCCLFHAAPMQFPQCSKHQSLNQTITYQGLGCSILSLATGIPSLALAAACPAHNHVCVAYGHHACFTSGPYSALHIYLLAAAYGPAHNHVCVACGPAPALCPGPYWARNALSGHSVPSSLLLCCCSHPAPLQAQPKSLCVVRADVKTLL